MANNHVVLCSSFRKRIARHMLDNSVLSPVHTIKLGSGHPDAGADDESRESMFSPIEGAVYSRGDSGGSFLLSVSCPDDYTILVSLKIDGTELVEKTIAEAALFDSAGLMIGYCLFPAKTKGSDEVYDFTIKLNF